MGNKVNEVMEGYQETEIGVLPEEWEVVRLGGNSAFRDWETYEGW